MRKGAPKVQIVITGKNLEVTDRLRSYVERKVNKLDRFLPNIAEARVELSVRSTRSAKDRHAVQLTLRADSMVLRAEERSSDMQTSIDAALDKMFRQIERYKGKRRRTRGRAQTAEPMVDEQEPESEDEIVRVKRFQMYPMDVEEAIEQMELLQHDFFVFFDVATNGFGVVYRRRDGGYGLLLPELA